MEKKRNGEGGFFSGIRKEKYFRPNPRSRNYKILIRILIKAKIKKLKNYSVSRGIFEIINWNGNESKVREVCQLP